MVELEDDCTLLPVFPWNAEDLPGGLAAIVDVERLTHVGNFCSQVREASAVFVLYLAWTRGVSKVNYY